MQNFWGTNKELHGIFESAWPTVSLSLALGELTNELGKVYDWGGRILPKT